MAGARHQPAAAAARRAKMTNTSAFTQIVVSVCYHCRRAFDELTLSYVRPPFPGAGICLCSPTARFSECPGATFSLPPHAAPASKVKIISQNTFTKKNTQHDRCYIPIITAGFIHSTLHSCLKKTLHATVCVETSTIWSTFG